MDAMNPKEPRPFSVKLILAETLAFCAVNQSYLYDSLKYLCFGVLVIGFFNSYRFGSFGLGFVVGSMSEIYLYTLLAVKCHRMFLVKEPASTFKDVLIWKKRDTNFISYGFMISLVMGIMVFPVVLFFSLQTLQTETIGSGSTYYIQALMVPICYISARLSLAFPAISIDKNIDFSKSWKMSRGNGWKLFFLIYLLPLGLHLISSYFFSGYLALRWVYTIMSIVVFIFEVFILSNAYRHLSHIIKKPVLSGE